MEVLSRRDALSHGMTDAMLYGKKWQRLTHGYYVSSSQSPERLELLRGLSAVLPQGAAFSGLTAAELYGWWLPPLPKPAPIFITANPSGRRPQRREFRVRRSHLPPEHVRALNGMPVTTAVRTLLDLAEVLSIIDLVVVADAALHRGDVTMAELQAAAICEPRRGIRTFRRMTDLANAKSESAWETMLRLLYVLCGIPVEVQVEIFDSQGGWVARSDLRIKGTVRLPEYDGASHRDRSQHQDDLRREKRLQRAGFERYGYIAREILTQPGVIIADAEDALGWPRQPERVEPWLVEFEKSLFSRAGQARWIKRWR
jgi:very-short-patch-repair endonuclease